MHVNVAEKETTSNHIAIERHLEKQKNLSRRAALRFPGHLQNALSERPRRAPRATTGICRPHVKAKKCRAQARSVPGWLIGRVRLGKGCWEHRMLTFMSLGGFDTFRSFRWLLSPRAARPGARGGNSGSCINTKNQHVRRCGGQPFRLIGHTPYRKRACTHDLTKQQSRHIPQHRHSRVGGPFIGTRTIRWQHLSAASRESRRDSSETRQSTGRQGDTGEQAKPTISPSPLMETFAKLSRTTIICSDFQSAKLDFPIDSRLRGNDGRFCKGLLDGRGIKGEGDPTLALGSEGEQDNTYHQSHGQP